MRKNGFIQFILLFLITIILVCFVLFSVLNKNKKLGPGLSDTSSTPSPENDKTFVLSPQPTAVVVPQEKNNKIIKNVALVKLDPKDDNGTGVIEKYNWKSPESLAGQYIAAVEKASDNLISYKITETIVFSEFPEKKSGFILDHEYYKKCLQSPNAYCREIIDYKKFFDKLDLCDNISQGKIQEIWAFNGPWFGFWEWSVKGPNINSLQENLPNCGNKTYTIMGFSYERSLSEMLEDLGHRFEAIMSQVPTAKPDWRLFTSQPYCGSVHIPPNGDKNYNWSNTKSVESFCNDFYTYPEFHSFKSIISCAEWGCNGEGYLKWWLSHIPGEWWKYVISPDENII